MKKIQTITVNSSGSGKIVFNNNYEIISSGLGEEITVWHANSGKLIHKLDDNIDVVRAIALSNDNTTLASSGDATGIKLWEVNTWKIALKIVAPTGIVSDLAFSPEKNILARGNHTNNCIELWDILEKRIKTRFDFGFFSFNPLDSTLAVGTNNKIDFYNIQTGKLTTTKHISERIISSLCFSPNGQWLALENEAEKICLLQASTLQIKHKIGHGDIKSPIFSPDSKIMATAHISGFINLWDIESGEMIEREIADFDLPDNLAFSHDGSLLACSSGGRSGGLIEVWEVA